MLITHEGTSQVKISKIDLFHSQYENFYMLKNETIDEMLSRSLKSLMDYLPLVMKSITIKSEESH